MMMWYGNGMSGWGYALMTIGMLIFWALVIGGLVTLVRYSGGAAPRGDAGARQTPQQILAERYARGEIDDEEYTRRLELLGTGTSS
ncbi:SHOCT domain-containing protein [Nocardia aurantiaca]|uniref:SHOCT domain-containing protein n=1 Tax=Nocardia aurantiaca TaxID=2675850 RepID=A0A6I3KPF6_9NOCA|nr:SHOCT domain-containing protein [Nocardia aurantiaca]MTE12493.1 SHOCT domain-containing protein [Nocardia aurantiaca]